MIQMHRSDFTSSQLWLSLFLELYIHPLYSNSSPRHSVLSHLRGDPPLWSSQDGICYSYRFHYELTISTCLAWLGVYLGVSRLVVYFSVIVRVSFKRVDAGLGLIIPDFDGLQLLSMLERDIRDHQNQRWYKAYHCQDNSQYNSDLECDR